MSTFCTNCGNMLPDQAAFCPNCGKQQKTTPVENTPPAATAEPVAPVTQEQAAATPITPTPVAPAAYQYSAPATPQKTVDLKKWLIPAIAVVAILAIVLLVLPGGKGGSGGGGAASSYEDALDNYFDVHMLGEVSRSGVKALAPDEYWDYMNSRYGDSFDEYYEEIMDDLGDYLEELETEFGSNVKVSYEITDEDSVSDRNLRKIASYLEDQYGIDDDDVTDALELALSYTVRGSKDEFTNEVDGVFVVKIDGRWYVASVDMDGTDTNVDFMI